MHNQSKQQESHEHHNHKPELEPSSRRYEKLKVLIAAIMGLTLVVLSGLTLTGSVLSLVLATPLLVLFSPVLVPAGVVPSLAATGFVFSGGCGVAAVNALKRLYDHASRGLARTRVKSSFVHIS